MEVSLFLDVAVTGPMADMTGRYRLVPMYLQQSPGKQDEVRYIHYEPNSAGWAVTQVGSDCIEDTCMFAYARDEKLPPAKGYVFGGPSMNVYYKQLLFDDADIDTSSDRGYRVTMSYTPDADTPAMRYLTRFNDRYVLQPYYVHEGTGKYAIFPTDFGKAPEGIGKNWVITGLMGEPTKRVKILYTATDRNGTRYQPPKGPWKPSPVAGELNGGAGFSFKIAPACANHVGDLACQQLESNCVNVVDDRETTWVKQCCRSTCGSCMIPRTACQLPQTNTFKGLGGAAALQLKRAMFKAKMQGTAWPKM